ncbi:MAG TPA: DUF1583 domain-containing protein [Gemmataceae bacterium]|nr:DUF1583 domain-containing protein [Gemmataceae bacterium]
MRLLAKDPAQRLQSAAEVAALLEGYLAHLRQPTLVSAPQLSPASHADRLRPPRTWIVGLGLAALVALVGVTIWFQADISRTKSEREEKDKAQAPQGRGNPRQQEHLVMNFRERVEELPPLSLFGPDLEAVTKAEPQGLRFTLPDGRDDVRGAMLTSAHRLRGDFDITLALELLTAGGPLPKEGAGVVLRAVFDAPSSLAAIVSRLTRPNGDVYVAHRFLYGPDDKTRYLDTKEVKATGPAGRLRLVRAGSRVRYLVAEGPEFREIQSVEFGTADIEEVQVHITTIGKPIALDVRLSELVIDADQFPDGMPASPAASFRLVRGTSLRASRANGMPATSSDASQAPGTRGWWTAIALCVLGLLSFAGMALWLLARQSRAAKENTHAAVPDRQETPPSPAPAMSFPCSGCGKRLKGRADLVGKNVKCPGCGQAVRVPGITAGEADSTSP